VNGWLWAATALVAALLPLLAVAARRPALEGIVALEVAGMVTAVALVLLSEGTNRQGFADLGIAVGIMSFAGSLAFLRFVERAR
jgi:multisubunit Na+/H+ antiporter MnhF subunit